MRYASTLAALLLAFTLIGSTGCSHQISGGPESGVEMSRYRSYYIVQTEKGDVATAIEKQLAARGFSVTTGPDSSAPVAADCKVISRDKWVWDMTMYLLEVKIEMVDARTGSMVASGRCYRTSMARKSPEEMVKEVLDRIYPPAPPAAAATAAGTKMPAAKISLGVASAEAY